MLRRKCKPALLSISLIIIGVIGKLAGSIVYRHLFPL
jgi:hypothetical protein